MAVEQERDSMQLAGLFPPGFGHIHPHQIRSNPPPQVRWLLETLDFVYSISDLVGNLNS